MFVGLFIFSIQVHHWLSFYTGRQYIIWQLANIVESFSEFKSFSNSEIVTNKDYPSKNSNLSSDAYSSSSDSPQLNEDSSHFITIRYRRKTICHATITMTLILMMTIMKMIKFWKSDCYSLVYYQVEIWIKLTLSLPVIATFKYYLNLEFILWLIDCDVLHGFIFKCIKTKTYFDIILSYTGE